MLRMASLFVTLSLLPVAAHSETLVAVRPGVMCVSAAALSQLIRPDGSSRSDSPNPQYAAIKASGGCINITLGARVDASVQRKNTSIVTYDSRDGRGPQTLIAPNIDFEATNDSGAAASSPRASVTSDDLPLADPAAGGIAIDTSLQAAEAKLRKEGFQIFQLQVSDPNIEVVGAIHGALMAPSTDHADMYSLDAIKDKIMLINHQLNFTQAQLVPTETLRTQLHQKYGVPAFETPVGESFMINWSFDTPPSLTPLAAQAACAEIFEQSAPFTQQGPGSAATAPTYHGMIPRRASPGCTGFITARNVGSSNPQLSSGVSVTVYDGTIYYNYLKDQAAAAANAGQQQVNQANKNQANGL